VLILAVSFLFNFLPNKKINKYDQLIFFVLISLTVFSISVRPMSFNDDENYISILEDFKTQKIDELGKISSLLYYLNIFIFKLVSNVKSVLKINFILIWLIIYTSLTVEKVKYKVRFFIFYLMIFQVLFFIQLRNAYAIAFLSWGLLREFRSKKGYVFFILSILFHYSVLPFILVYFLINKKYHNLNTINLKKILLLFLFTIILSIVFFEFYNAYIVTLPLFERYLFDYISTPEIGNTSILQLSLLFFHLVLIFMYKDNLLMSNSDRIKYSCAIYAGLLIAILFFSLPLFQRLIVPFYLYSIIITLKTNSLRFTGFFRSSLSLLVLLIYFAISINRISYFEDWFVL
jgi:hypothetical protein